MATARDLSQRLTDFRVAADSPMTLDTWERAASACTAYLVATTLTAPLDRVKTTLQSNPNLSRAGARATASMIIRQDGMTGLFRGLGPALAMAPAVALQYTLMDELGQMRMNPLAASLVVGTIDVVARAPFENVKIALQGGGSASNVLRNARAMGPQTLWRGLGATLVRDLPYTVLFWTSVAALRASVAPADASADNGGGNGMFLNFACGAVAGAFAATLVTPQDAIKTRMQLAAHRNLAFSTAAREAVATGGPTALFAGLSARLLRIPLYSAVTLSTFETMKRAFERA